MNFAEWEATAASDQTIEVSRDITRDIYQTPNGIGLMHDVCFPWNPFAKQREWVLVQYILPACWMPAVKLAGGELNTEDYYTEEGYGMAVFEGEDAMERAFNFSQTLRKETPCLTRA